MEGEEFYLQAITPKGKPDFAEYLVDEETYPALENNRRFRLPISRYVDSEVIVGNDFNLNYSVDKNNERNYTLPNVTVKARLRTEKVKDTHEFYSTTYVGREEIDKRPHRDLFNILEDMQGIVVGKVWGEEGMTYTLSSTRSNSVISTGHVVLPILVDGTRRTDYNIIFNMPSAEIESVRVLRAWEALAYTYGAIHGAILITTRNAREREPLPSKGATYAPTGLSPLSHPYKEIALPALKCSKPGNYRLIVDVITDSDIRSYEHAFQVVE
jgi:outer membrane cobalamin receptor